MNDTYEYAITPCPRDDHGNPTEDLGRMMAAIDDDMLEDAFDDLVESYRDVLPEGMFDEDAYESMVFSTTAPTNPHVLAVFMHNADAVDTSALPKTIVVTPNIMRGLVRALCNDLFTNNALETKLDIRRTSGLINPGGMPYLVSGGAPKNHAAPTTGYDAIMLIDALGAFENPI